MKHGIEQFLDSELLKSGNLAEEGLSAPLLGHQAEVRLLHHPFGLGIGKIDLVDGDNDRDVGRLGVVDRLAGLGHDAVIGRNDQNDDVGQLSAAGPHHAECGVPGGIQEHHISFPRQIYFIRTDMLGDAAVLPFGHLCRTNRIKQLRFSMVDVSHDGDDRSPLDKFLVLILIAGDDRLVVEGDQSDITVVFITDNLCGFKVDLLVDRYHHSHLEEHRDDFRGFQVHLLGKIRNGDHLHHIDGFGNGCQLGGGLFLPPLNLELALFFSIAALVGLILSFCEGFLLRALMILWRSSSPIGEGLNPPGRPPWRVKPPP